MDNSYNNITALQNQLNSLQKENILLKNLLERSGIPYREEIIKLKTTLEHTKYDENQGARIKHPDKITEEMANIFYSRFWGRQDAFVKRSEKNGKSAYYVQCSNFWSEVCPKKFGKKMDCGKCTHMVYTHLTMRDVLAHLKGNSPTCNDVIGVYPLLPGGKCRFIVFDFDNHDTGADKNDNANTDDRWIEEVEAMRTICELNGIDSLVERSRSGKGAHIWIFFKEAISAATARKFGFSLLEHGAEQVNLRSFKFYDRMLPAQDELPDGKVGNVIALPLQGRALRNGNSAFIDKDWNAYPNQWEVLYNKPRLSLAYIEEKIKEWNQNTIDVDKREAANNPWNKNDKFSISDIKGNMSIILADGIYIDTLNLNPGIQNKIRRMAAFRNPIYYKNRAIGLKNYATSQWIYLGEDCSNGYIKIPRGIYGELIEKLEESNIEYNIKDERVKGDVIDVNFKGRLRDEQIKALKDMMKYDNGILQAATAFGKTVVCSALIAEKKVNTLIILESSALIEQWKESLNKFLDIKEELPEYKTKSGRVKVRKSLIGKLQGASDSTTGIIDIAMAGSIKKKDGFHPRLQNYGMVIVDECHHAASDTIAEVLKEVKSKYVYGVTATPKRSDGLEKINYMLLGPIRHCYTAKDRAESQGIDHFVYPRFTRTVLPRGVGNVSSPNEAYELIRNNDVRDKQIVGDIVNCIKENRTPVVLTKYKDHAEKFYERLRAQADYVFIMTGNNSKKEHKAIYEKMREVPDDKSLILIATGSLIGEGFDFPRLDTLIMATPVSFRSVVEQYAGRLNRDYDGKKNVIVYDYVDSHIPMFDKMYVKRLRAYKQIGFDICGSVESEKIKTDAIYDNTNYRDIYRRDLLGANKTIVISSPAISGSKVNELIELLKEKQEKGVQVTIVTWAPDDYGYGDSAFWMQLHDEMRCAGFYIKTVEDTCEHFCVIDGELVWYGNMNLLAKDSIEDSMMRIRNKDIAAELMELTFTYKSRLQTSVKW